MNCSTCGANSGFSLPKFPKLLSRASVGRVCMKMENRENAKNLSLMSEKDGVIIVDHGSRRKESNLMLNEFVAMFRDKTGYPIVEPAHMELAEPSIRDAFRFCVQQGANRVIVSPFFLFPGRHWYQDIPSLTAEAAKEHPNVPYIITAPLGLHELLVDVVNDRIKHCVSHVEGDVGECTVCAGTGKYVRVQLLPLQHAGRLSEILGPNFLLIILAQGLIQPSQFGGVATTFCTVTKTLVVGYLRPLNVKWIALQLQTVHLQEREGEEECQ